MLQLRRRPQKDLERIHARYVRANRRQLDFRVWVAGGWGIVIGLTAMWLFQRLLT